MLMFKNQLMRLIMSSLSYLSFLAKAKSLTLYWYFVDLLAFISAAMELSTAFISQVSASYLSVLKSRAHLKISLQT